MKNIVYYVASSVDGYISGINDDVSQFIYEGKAVEKYLKDLKTFQTVIMGRNTYEFGYRFGVKPGDPSPVYAHMKHYIFSDNLKFDHQSEQVEIKKLVPEEIDQIKEGSRTDIYLCGGGRFAGWLLENKKIDVLKIKLNPLIINQGVKLFEGVATPYHLHLEKCEVFDNGMQIMTYSIQYGQ
jgi:dihydrofolate reductase